MTFPVNGILDNFNRADGALGANWAVGEANFYNGTHDGLSISSNRVVHGLHLGHGGGDEATWTVSTVGPDLEVYFTVANTVNFFYSNWALAWRWQNRANTNDIYTMEWGDDDGTGTNLDYWIDKIKGGTYSRLLSGQVAHRIAAGDQLGISMIGSVIKVYLNGTQIDTVTDGDPITGAGYLAFEIADGNGAGASSCGLDDFGGGTLASRTGDLSKTLGILLLSSLAYLEKLGTLSQTLGALSLSSDAYLERLGALSQTLAALTLAASGDVESYHVPTLINVRTITALGNGAIGVDVVNQAIVQNVRANSLQVEDGGSLEAHSVYFDTIATLGSGTIVPTWSDRAVWDVASYSARHASDIDGSTWLYHNDPALLGTYAVSNPSVDRILDVASVSLSEVAAILGTLLQDLGLA